MDVKLTLPKALNYPVLTLSDLDLMDLEEGKAFREASEKRLAEAMKPVESGHDGTH